MALFLSSKIEAEPDRLDFSLPENPNQCLQEVRRAEVNRLPLRLLYILINSNGFLK